MSDKTSLRGRLIELAEVHERDAQTNAMLGDSFGEQSMWAEAVLLREAAAALARSEAQGEGRPAPPATAGGGMRDALAEFTDYFVRNYPGPDTIITDPRWHAPRIFRAAAFAIRKLAPPPPADRAQTTSADVDLTPRGATFGHGTTTADRAPGGEVTEEMADAFYSAYDMAREADDDMRQAVKDGIAAALAARAPSAQGEAVVWQYRMNDEMEWQDCSREEYEQRRLACAHLRHYAREWRVLYTSAPAAGDGRLHRLLTDHRDYLVNKAMLFPEGSEMVRQIDEMLALAHPTAGEQQREERHG